MTGAAED
jgi:[ribosomal protein S5]-alanine N-acetyltransferase